jgi:serine/threonine protein kinase
LTKHLFDVKGDFFHGERVYNITHRDFYSLLTQQPNFRVLKDFTRYMCESLHALAQAQVVHADLKPDNILLSFSDSGKLTGVKLIDFGSSFDRTGSGNISATTPEYLAPEVLQLICANKQQNGVQVL